MFQKLKTNETEEGMSDLKNPITFKSSAKNNKKRDVSEEHASTEVLLLKREPLVQNEIIGTYMCLL